MFAFVDDLAGEIIGRNPIVDQHTFSLSVGFWRDVEGVGRESNDLFVRGTL